MPSILTFLAGCRVIGLDPAEVLDESCVPTLRKPAARLPRDVRRLQRKIELFDERRQRILAGVIRFLEEPQVAEQLAAA